MASLSYKSPNGKVTDVSGVAIGRENYHLWGEVSVGANVVLGWDFTIFAQASRTTAARLSARAMAEKATPVSLGLRGTCGRSPYGARLSVPFLQPSLEKAALGKPLDGEMVQPTVLSLDFELMLKLSTLAYHVKYRDTQIPVRSIGPCRPNGRNILALPAELRRHPEHHIFHMAAPNREQTPP